MPRAAAFVLGVVAAGYFLISAGAGYPAFRDQHLGTALLYMQEGVDLLHAKMVGFNANGMPAMLEFPLWQAGAAWVMRAMGGWWGGANLFSLLVFLLGGFPAYRLGKRLLGREGGYWVLVAFLVQPVVFENAGMASPDGMGLVVALWAYDRIRAWALRGGGRRGISAAILAALAATLKLPFFMTAGIAAAVEVLLPRARAPGPWIRLGGVAVFSGAIFWAWTRYTNSWFEQALWPLVDLRVGQNPEMVYWYFGDWAYRLSPAVWLKAGWKAANGLWGSFALAGIALGGWCLPKNTEGRAWLFGALITTAVFSHLVLHHNHYYLMFSPAVALGMAAGGLRLLDLAFTGNPLGLRVAQIVGVVLLVLSLVQGIIAREIVLQFDPYPRTIARQVAEKTSEQDRLLIIGGGWGGETLFRADRRGLSIWNTRFLEDPSNLRKARELGFTKLVVIRESPLQVALQKTNPGGANYEGEPLSLHLTPVAVGFPVLYQDDQLMIRNLTPTYSDSRRR